VALTFSNMPEGGIQHVLQEDQHEVQNME